jgi:hypothetical protein
VRWRAKATRPGNEPLDNFWQGSPPTIDFKACTARKMVIAPPRTVVGFVYITLLGLEVVRENIEAQRTAPEPSKQIPTSLLEPKDWFVAARQEHPRLSHERLTGYAGRLHEIMKKAPVTKLWSEKTIRRRLYDRS